MNSLFASVLLTAAVLSGAASFPSALNAQTIAGRQDSSAVFQRQWDAESSQTHQRIAVGQTQSTIVVDGRINDSEWHDATEISDLLDKGSFDTALNQTHIWITYDRKNLYIAMQSLLPIRGKDGAVNSWGEAFLRSRAIADDTNVDFDDSLGLNIIPNYPHGNLYKLYVNNIGTRYDYLFYNKGDYAVDIKWDPRWVSKSRVNGKSWNIEVAIPIPSFGMNAIRDGDVWALNVERIWRMLRSGTDQWAIGGAEGKNSPLPWRMGPLGQVEFVGSRGVVVRSHGFAGLLTGKIRGNLQLTNRDKQARDVSVRLALASKALFQEELHLEAGVLKTVNVKADLITAMAGLLSFSVVDKRGRILYIQQLPFKPQNGLNIALKKYPSRSLLQAAWDLRLPYGEINNFSLELRLQNTAKTALAVTKSIAALRSPIGKADFQTAALPLGSYRLTAVLKRAGRTVATRQLSYVKQEKPSWLGNKYGVSEIPPPPWTPVREKNDRVDIWNRQVRYDGQLFPAQIINRKTPMLARPMEINAQLDGQKSRGSFQSKSAIKVQWLNKNASRVSSRRIQSVSGLRLTSTSYLEFDGMTWIELDVAPQLKNTRLRKLSFDVPLNKEWAQLINTYDYTLRTTGKIPANGWSGRMRPLWIGNGDGGLQFFAESDAAWQGSKRLDVRMEGSAVVLRANLVDTPINLSKPLKFAFGFITTPVKPAPQNHRDWRVISGYSSPQNKATLDYLKVLSARNKNLQVFDLWNQGWWWLPKKFEGNADWTGFLPVPGETVAKSYLQPTSDGYEVRRCLYGRLSQIGTNNPWFKQYGDEWVSDKNLVFDIPPTADSVLAQTEVSAASASYRDFVAWGYHQLFSTHRVPGLYFDVSDVVEDNNLYHGGGVATGSGDAIPAQSILGQREVLKRVYTMLKEHDPKAAIFHHMSGHVLMPVDSFVDAQIDGENTFSLLDLDKNRGYEKVLSLDQFRAEYAGQNNFGPVGVMLDQFGRRGSIVGEDWKTMRHHGDYLVGLSLLHDSTNWWSYMPPEVYADMYGALDTVGVDSSYIFVPYWRQQALKLPARVVASFFVSPQRTKAALVLMNASDKSRSVNLEISGSKLGLNAPIAPIKVLYPPQSGQKASGNGALPLAAYGVTILEVSPG